MIIQDLQTPLSKPTHDFNLPSFALPRISKRHYRTTTTPTYKINANGSLKHSSHRPPPAPQNRSNTPLATNGGADP